jgi:hypothetical protein
MKPYIKHGLTSFRRCSAIPDRRGLMHCERMLPNHRLQFRDDANLFLSDTQLPTGIVCSTPTVEIRLEPLEDTLYGMVNVSRSPYIMTLNANMTYPRVRISLVHEYMHIFCHLHKIDLTHEQLHLLAVIMNNDIVPSLGQLDRFTNQAWTN